MIAADASLAQASVSGLRDYSSLSEVDKSRFIATYMAFPSCSQDAFLKWRDGSLSPELWLAWEFVMMNFVNVRPARYAP